MHFFCVSQYVSSVYLPLYLPAEALGSTDPAAYGFVNEAYAFLGSPASKDPAAVLGMCMKLGGANFGVMKMLSEGHARRCVWITKELLRLSADCV